MRTPSCRVATRRGWNCDSLPVISAIAHHHWHRHSLALTSPSRYLPQQ